MEHWQITIKLRYQSKPQVIDIDMPAWAFIGYESGWFQIGNIYATNAKDVIWWHKEVITTKK